jgi:hypothetical protein
MPSLHLLVVSRRPERWTTESSGLEDSGDMAPLLSAFFFSASLSVSLSLSLSLFHSLCLSLSMSLFLSLSLILSQEIELFDSDLEIFRGAGGYLAVRPVKIFLCLQEEENK